MADEWFDVRGNLLSGKTWEDLNDYILSMTHEIWKEKNTYTGWVTFEVLTKYISDGENVISALTSNVDIQSNEHWSDF